MEDEKIVELYWKREDAALEETSKKYGKYLLKIAYNILSNFEDSEESVNDTYFKAWKSIPPEKPKVLSSFLGKIVRENSIDIYRKRKRKKRKSEYEISLSELGDFVEDKANVQSETEADLLVEKINDFLENLDEENRKIFVCRYFYFDSLKTISKYFSMKEDTVKSRLFRMRNSLKSYLEKEGFEI